MQPKLMAAPKLKLTRIRLNAGLLLALALPLGCIAGVVRPAPDFALRGGKSLHALRGQPVVLVVAPSPESRAFRKEVRLLESGYAGLAARNAVFVAAFTRSDAGVIRSNIPFATAAEGAGLALKYPVGQAIGVFVIGRDGNLDLAVTKVAPVYQIRDAILNNSELQTAERNNH